VIWNWGRRTFATPSQARAFCTAPLTDPKPRVTLIIGGGIAALKRWTYPAAEGPAHSCPLRAFPPRQRGSEPLAAAPSNKRTDRIRSEAVDASLSSHRDHDLIAWHLRPRT
jgi:hypothetical protein